LDGERARWRGGVCESDCVSCAVCGAALRVPMCAVLSIIRPRLFVALCTFFNVYRSSLLRYPSSLARLCTGSLLHGLRVVRLPACLFFLCFFFFLVSLRGRVCCKRLCRLFLVFCGQKWCRGRRAKPPHVLHGVTTVGAGDRRGPLPVAPRRAALVACGGRGDDRVTNQPGRIGGGCRLRWRLHSLCGQEGGGFAHWGARRARH